MLDFQSLPSSSFFGSRAAKLKAVLRFIRLSKARTARVWQSWYFCAKISPLFFYSLYCFYISQSMALQPWDVRKDGRRKEKPFFHFCVFWANGKYGKKEQSKPALSHYRPSAAFFTIFRCKVRKEEDQTRAAACGIKYNFRPWREKAVAGRQDPLFYFIFRWRHAPQCVSLTHKKSPIRTDPAFSFLGSAA